MARRAQKKKIIKDVFSFLIRFNILLIPFYAIIYFDINFYSIQIALTNFLALILKSLNYKVSTSNFFLFVGDSGYPIDISRDCVGWKSSYSLFALVFATPGDRMKKLKFLSIWIPVLLVINIFRVVITLLVGLNLGIQYLEIIHKFLWEQVMIVSLLAIWYLWLRKGKLNIKKLRNIL